MHCCHRKIQVSFLYNLNKGLFWLLIKIPTHLKKKGKGEKEPFVHLHTCSIGIERMPNLCNEGRELQQHYAFNNGPVATSLFRLL